MNVIEIYVSNDDKDYKLHETYTLKMNEDGQHIQTLKFDAVARYLQIKALSNYNDDEFKEGLFGLNKVRFYNNTQQYKDIYAHANSVLLEENEHAWIWLQDGAVVGDRSEERRVGKECRCWW